MGEVLQQSEQLKQSALEGVKKAAEKIDEKQKIKLGEKIADKVETRKSTMLLKDFSEREQSKDNATLKEVLKNSENKEKIQNMQYMLGYRDPKNPQQVGKKIYYNPCRRDIKDGSFLTKTPDGKAGPFTIGAMNNMIADDKNPEIKEKGILEIRNISKLEGVNDFIGTLHPYFYNKLDKTAKILKTNNETEKNNAQIVLDMMSKIKESTAIKEDIQSMQKALHNLKQYPSIHNKEQKDGVPGQFTQIALQNFVFQHLA